MAFIIPSFGVVLSFHADTPLVYKGNTMSRPMKATVDYFPHYCHNGKTVFIIEQEYGNDGYAFIFKMFELLGSTENHFIDCNIPADWQYLLSKTKLKSEIIAEDILDTLAKLGTIDTDLWKCKVVWSENYVSNLLTVYNRRRVNVYGKPELADYCKQKYPSSWNGANINPQSKVKYSKVNESKKTYMDIPDISFVKLTQEDYDKLGEQLGVLTAKEKIQDLEYYIGSKGKQYKSHYHTILSWARKDEKEREKK